LANNTGQQKLMVLYGQIKLKPGKYLANVCRRKIFQKAIGAKPQTAAKYHMRNLSDQGIPILVHPSGKWNDLVGFVVTNRFGKLYINQSTPRYFQSSGGYSLAPQIQQKHLKFLNGDYSLTNGTYSVHAEIRTIPINLPQRMANEPVAGKLVMVKSAEVQIIITNSP
jgi:hypothetical protein